MSAYTINGPSALVPGTALRLPVIPNVRDLPAEQRCRSCAGTGVDFVGGVLETCFCMELPELPAPEFASSIVVTEVLV